MHATAACCGGSGSVQERVRALAQHWTRTADSQPVRALVHRSRRRHVGHGSLWQCPPLRSLAGSDGREVRLLPARYVGAYVKRNKTNAADAAALLQALRDEDICARMGEVGRATGAAGPASIAQRLDGHAHRALQHTARLLPRVRHHASWRWPTISQGSRLGIEQIGRVLADPASGVATLLRSTMQLADRGEPAAGGAHRSAREATRAAGTPIARVHSYVLARAFAAHVKGSLTSPHCS